MVQILNVLSLIHRNKYEPADEGSKLLNTDYGTLTVDNLNLLLRLHSSQSPFNPAVVGELCIGPISVNRIKSLCLVIYEQYVHIFF